MPWWLPCSQNVHDETVLAWDKSASWRAQGWEGEDVARSKRQPWLLLLREVWEIEDSWKDTHVDPVLPELGRGIEPDDLLCTRNARPRKALV